MHSFQLFLPFFHSQLHPESNQPVTSCTQTLVLPSTKIQDQKKQPAKSKTHREFPCFPTRPVVWHVLPHGTSAGVQTAPTATAPCLQRLWDIDASSGQPEIVCQSVFACFRRRQSQFFWVVRNNGGLLFWLIDGINLIIKEPIQKT